MDLSAVIFVLLAVAWAVYLIPRALRHHDEAARTRSIDTFSDSTRVLARSEPAEDRDTRLVVTTAGPASPSVEPIETYRRTPASAARAAARRRRRILAFLLLCVLGTIVAAGLAYLPWWSVGVPAALTVSYLVLCRTQVRRAVRTAPARHAPVRDRVVAPEPVDDLVPAPVPAAAPDSPAAQVDEGSDVPFDAESPVELVEPAAAMGNGSGTIWDPLPVTLPTYVTAPKAHRTVRTIDLGEPGTWTSGRTAEDAEIAVQAAQPEAPDGTGRRAVGS